MEFKDILAALTGKAGKKGFFCSVRVDRKNGEVCSMNISMDKVEKPSGKDKPCGFPGPEKDGKIEISVNERREIPPPDGGKGQNMLKEALMGMAKPGKMSKKTEAIQEE